MSATTPTTAPTAIPTLAPVLRGDGDDGGGRGEGVLDASGVFVEEGRFGEERLRVDAGV
jgi:hypothetical protein